MNRTRTLATALLLGLSAAAVSTPANAAPCRDAHGRFIACAGAAAKAKPMKVVSRAAPVKAVAKPVKIASRSTSAKPAAKPVKVASHAAKTAKTPAHRTAG